MKWEWGDGGRSDAGLRGTTGDCGVRALAYGLGAPYGDIVGELVEQAAKFGTHRVTQPLAGAPEMITGVDVGLVDCLLKKRGWRDGGPLLRRDPVGHWYRPFLSGFALPRTCVVSTHPPTDDPGHYFAVVDGLCRDLFDPLLPGHTVGRVWTPPFQFPAVLNKPA